MTVYSDLDVKQALVDGHVVCRPLRPENIKGSSIDLTLGEYFWRCDARPHGVFNPYDATEVERYFAGPFQAKPYASVYKKLAGDPMMAWPAPAGDSGYMGRRHLNQPHPFVGIPEDWPVIVLRPRERLLAHSHEFVGIHAPGTTMLKARSSSGRVGIRICSDAGWGDPGFVNRWTFEVENVNDEAIVLPIGERIAQIIFFETGEVGASYTGKYQASESVSGLITDWKPQDMLPRSWKDERQVPLPLDEESYAAAVEGLSVPA